MYCGYCGAPNTEGTQYCTSCGKPLAATTKSASAPPIPTAPPKKKLGKVTKIVICFGAVFIILASILSSPSKEEQDKKERAAISAVRQQWFPTTRFVLLHPDTKSVSWFAVKDPIECTYGHPERKNCWKVIHTINVMPGTEVKEIKSEFLIDMDTKQTQANNTEASTLWERQ